MVGDARETLYPHDFINYVQREDKHVVENTDTCSLHFSA